MRFYFHIVTGESIYPDVSGAECADLRTVIENVRAAVAELRAEEEIELASDNYVLITSPQLSVALVLPMVDL